MARPRPSPHPQLGPRPKTRLNLRGYATSAIPLLLRALGCGPLGQGARDRCFHVPVELIVQAQWAAEKGGHHRFLTEQPRYSIFTRTIQAAVLPAAQRYGMGVLTYGPLGSGWLSGRADPTSGHRVATAAEAFDLTVPATRRRRRQSTSSPALPRRRECR
jgi:hypothetical protein